MQKYTEYSDININMTKKQIQELIEKNPRGYHHILKKYPETKNVVNTYPGKKFSQKLYNYLYGIEETPVCSGIGCDKSVAFVNVKEGYKERCIRCYKQQRKDNSVVQRKIYEQKNKQRPICRHPSCDKEVAHKKDGTWSKFCSKKCTARYNSLSTRDATKKYWFEKYGVDHPKKSEEVRNNEKQKLFEKYGVYNMYNVPGARENYKKSCLQNLGVDNPSKSEKVREKHRCTCLKKYGVSNPSQSVYIHNKKVKSSYKSKDYTLPSGKIISVQGYENVFLDYVLKVINEDDIREIVPKVEYQYKDKNKVYIPDFYIEKMNLLVEVKSKYTYQYDKDLNDVKIIASVEAGYNHVLIIFDETSDVGTILYTDQKKLQLLSQINEFELHPLINGRYYDAIINDVVMIYHNPFFYSEVFVEIKYLKNIIDNIKDQYVPLVIGVNDMNNKYTTIYQHLKYKTLKQNKKIYARKCYVSEIKKDKAREFLDENHIQGFSPSQVYLGLIYEEELVSLMSFSKPRALVGKSRGDNVYELIRFSTKYNVPGAAGKLLKYFERKYNPEQVYSYSDNRISQGNLYKTLGFDIEKDNNPGYYYVYPFSPDVFSRYSFTKGSIRNKYPTIYNVEKTERQMTREIGLVRFYDAGKITWIKNF